MGNYNTSVRKPKRKEPIWEIQA